MTINVVCPGCHKRFKVSDGYAGRKGPCPKCKAEITIPKPDEEVKVHTPEAHGPKGISGKAVLKPIKRTETKISPLMLLAIIGGIVVVLLIALVLRFIEGGPPAIVLVLGAILLAPPLVLGGYSFLRDDELEAHRGKSLLIRVACCAGVYAVMWAVYAFIPGYLEIDKLEVFHLLFIIPPIVVVGAFAAVVSLELDFGVAAVHYGLYLLVTVLLCVIMGVSLL